MTFASKRNALSIAFLAVVAFAQSSCNSTHVPRGADNEGLVTGRLLSVNPLEVVVLPIENHTGDASVPCAAMREQFQQGLVQLRYSPLALSFVDRSSGVVEASYKPGALGEHAVLRVVLTGWDDSRWKSHAHLVVDADIYMLDAANPDPSMALWGGHAVRTVDLELQRNSVAGDEALRQRAVEEVVSGILGSLPARNPERSNGPTR